MERIFVEVDDSNSPVRQIWAQDFPTWGGACHQYAVLAWGERTDVKTVGELRFQAGPEAVMGRNGLRNEDLLHIIAHRLNAWQGTPLACIENADALACVRSALAALERRTARRRKLGIEGAPTEVH